jgi:hypothetical protein
MNIGEFFVELGANADTKSVREFGSELLDLPIKSALAVAALAKITFEFQQIAAAAMDAAVGFQMFSAQTGLSSQELQRWQLVAEQANVSGQAVQASVMGLQRNMAEIAMGRGNISPFQLLGINPRQNAFAVLDQLRDRIKGLDQATAVNLMTQMGLDPQMIQLLKLSNEEFKTLEGNIVGMTAKQQEAFLATKRSLVQLSQAFRGLGYQILEVVAPYAERLVNIFMMLVNWTSQLVSGVQQFVRLLASVPGNLAAIGIALAPLFITTFPLTGALIALLLVLDDLAVYGRGGKSVTGLAIEGLQKLGKEISDMLLKWPKLATFAMTFGSALAGVPMSQAQAQKLVQQNQVNINVNSTADAAETARQTKSEFDRATSDAALQTNNGGL